jgi:hypothetical protein
MRWQVFGVGISTVISALGLGLIIWKTDPTTASSILKVSFFVASFIFVWGGSTLVIFSIKKEIPKPRPLDESTGEAVFNASILLGLLLSLLITGIVLVKKFT